MITLALKVSKGASKVGRKSPTKVAAGRKGGKVSAGRVSKVSTKTASKVERKPITDEEKRAKARAYYVANRAKILKYTKKRYQKHTLAIRMYVRKWRKKTQNGTKPLYAQGKANGKRPRYARLVRLNGKGKGRDVTTGKTPATTASARIKVKKAEEKFDRAREKKVAPKAVSKIKKAVAKKAAVSVKKAIAKLPAKKISRKPFK